MKDKKTKKTKDIMDNILNVVGDVDVVFVIDSTGSMGPYIDEARRYMVDIATRIEKDAKLNFKFAVVAYRDHPPQDTTFVTDVFDFVSLSGLQIILNGLIAGGGGDRPDAVWDGVKAACNLSWRNNSDRIIYLVGDSPAHGHAGEFSGDAWPQGCPCGITDQELIDTLTNLGIELNAHSIANAPDTTETFKVLADPTKGTVTVGNRPEQMTTSYSRSWTSHGAMVGTSATVLNAMASTGVSYDTATSNLGFGAEESTKLKSYLNKRGLIENDAIVNTTVTTKKDEEPKA